MVYSVKTVPYKTGPTLQQIRLSQRFSSLHRRLKFNILCNGLVYRRNLSHFVVQILLMLGSRKFVFSLAENCLCKVCFVRWSVWWLSNQVFIPGLWKQSVNLEKKVQNFHSRFSSNIKPDCNVNSYCVYEISVVGCGFLPLFQVICFESSPRQME